MVDDIFVYYHKLPDGVNEAVLSCFGGYTIYIDPRQSEDGIRRSYQHAIQHIRNGDFEQSDVQEIENRTHGGPAYVDRETKRQILSY